jgi:hypothetical protein
VDGTTALLDVGPGRLRGVDGHLGLLEAVPFGLEAARVLEAAAELVGARVELGGNGLDGRGDATAPRSASGQAGHEGHPAED